MIGRNADQGWAGSTERGTRVTLQCTFFLCVTGCKKIFKTTQPALISHLTEIQLYLSCVYYFAYQYSIYRTLGLFKNFCYASDIWLEHPLQLQEENGAPQQRAARSSAPHDGLLIKRIREFFAQQ